jgi:HK97 family phage major capsid protein
VNLTQALKNWAVKNLGIAADATDEVFRLAIGKAIIAGKIKHKELGSLQKDATAAPIKPADKKGDAPIPGVNVNDPQFKEALGSAVQEALKGAGIGGEQAISAEGVFAKGTQIRVKSVAENYDHSKKGAYFGSKMANGDPHPFAGQPATILGRSLNHPTQLDKAVAGAYFKWCVANSSNPADVPPQLRPNQHEKDLVQYALRELEWSGLIKDGRHEDMAMKVDRRKLTMNEVKALLDDGTSGGIEAAPIAFDDAIVLIPVLYGELFPFVNVVNVSRGRRMKGAAMSNPTITSGTAEGTAIGLFNTAGFVTAFDTTIFPSVGAMEIGLDFLEDSPTDIGNRIIENYGYKSLEYLDRVIASGNGTTEPEGILVATGTVSVNSDNGIAGPPTVSDYEQLMFGLAKEFRNEPGAMVVYLSDDTGYQRARSIQVGVGDERRVFGMDHQSYSLLGWPYKVQNNVTRGQIAAANLKRYRMYRRLGMNMRIETAGYTLARSNTKLIVLRQRYGGRLETGGAAAVMLDGQQ